MIATTTVLWTKQSWRLGQQECGKGVAKGRPKAADVHNAHQLKTMTTRNQSEQQLALFDLKLSKPVFERKPAFSISSQLLATYQPRPIRHFAVNAACVGQ